MAGARLDFSVLLEPLTFVKVLEWIFATFAFATCGGFQGETILLVSCQGMVNKTVTAALLILSALVVHIGYKHVYDQNRRFPLTDLVITVITAFLWLVSTSAWAKVLADIKMFTEASIILGIESCKAPGTTCHFAAVTSMGALNMSVACMPSAILVFGLINMILWGGNIWFVYKDTNLRNQPNRISQSPAIYQIQRGE